jgi:hypothetical protein
MPLRKKHLRWTVAVLLLAGALGPILALTVYGLRLRGDAYGREVAAELESRLRCAATVTGARPTGPSTAVAESAAMTWTTDQGQLALRLDDLTAESNRFGWYVRAARGRLALAGPGPAETLAALNQRLVQTQAETRLVSLVVERLTVSAEVAGRTFRTELSAVAVSNMTAYTVHLSRPGAKAAAVRGPSDEPRARPRVTVRLNPVSEHGVFGGIAGELRDVPLGIATAPGSAAAVALDLTADWPAPPQRKPATLRLALRDLDLAAWTPSAPGGSLTGKGQVTFAWSRSTEPGRAESVLGLESDGGRVGAETLRWLEGLPMGVRGPKQTAAPALGYDRLSVRCRVVGDRAWFEGPADPAGGIALMTVRVLGVPVPVVRASGQAFDVRAVWPALAKALAPDAAPAQPAATPESK